MNKAKSIINEIILAVGIIGILFLLANSNRLLMPSNIETMLQVLFIILFLGFAALIWRERAKDEREELHRLRAGRISFLVGSASLVIGIVYQASSLMDIDPWLLFTLVAMIVSKLVSRMYSDARE